jgi:hypothetical protein
MIITITKAERVTVGRKVSGYQEHIKREIPTNCASHVVPFNLLHIGSEVAEVDYCLVQEPL